MSYRARAELYFSIARQVAPLRSHVWEWQSLYSAVVLNITDFLGLSVPLIKNAAQGCLGSIKSGLGGAVYMGDLGDLEIYLCPAGTWPVSQDSPLRSPVSPAL